MSAPELFELAQKRRDDLADRMDSATDAVEDWLKGIKPVVIEGGA